MVDFWTQMVLDGRTFHMQIGTESAPVASTTVVADTLVWMVLDGAVGTTYIPALYEVDVNTLASATIPEAYLEIDRAKARYSSGGTAFVPENLRTDRPRVSVAVNPVVGTDVTLSAKTAVPGSMEIGHYTWFEDAIATGTGTDVGKHYRLMATERTLGVVVGVGSIACHFGAATADVTGYGCIQWVELPSESVT